ncbi:MAG: DNA repair protein RecN [Candidatus Omnitrophota bacterium]
MISNFTIQNFGLIDRLTIEFCKSLNVFTGETGAGKSILIGALHFALGKRLNSAQIRNPEKPCVVEIVFELSPKLIKESPIFSEYLQEEEPVIIINRSYFPDGRNKNRINGFSVTLAQLKELGARLIDFHGPHDHQMLFSEESHIMILDRLCDFNHLKDDYAQQYSVYSGLQNELNNLHNLAQNREREQDMLRHQIKELEQVSLHKSDYDQLLQEQARLNNAEKLYECTAKLIDVLENNDTGIDSSISRAFCHFNTLNNIDETTSEFTAILGRIQQDSSELSSLLSNYLEKLSFNPGEAEEINNRYDVYYELLRKYGSSIDDVNNYYLEAKKKYSLLIDIEHNDAELRKKINSSKKVLNATAQKITALRIQTADSLEETIKQELQELGIANIRFECRIEKTDLSRTGQDKITLYISPNIGEELKPLAEIISSGEAARVMLALKKALTKVDPIPVLIFDEIDAQIGGRLGTITGKKLKKLSKNRQVILVTHLPQIASFGDSHFKVSKSIENNRTITTVTLLKDDTRINELAQMMSGKKESQIALKHAHDMLNQATK